MPFEADTSIATAEKAKVAGRPQIQAVVLVID
jgi:hypothetical protein